MKDSIVISEDIRDLPEQGEAIFINKAGQKIRFINGNIEGRLPTGNEDTTVLL